MRFPSILRGSTWWILPVFPSVALALAFLSRFKHRPITGLHGRSILAWLKAVVAFAYSYAPSDTLRLFCMTAHDVRRFATSLASFYNMPFDNLMKVAYWYTVPLTSATFAVMRMICTQLVPLWLPSLSVRSDTRLQRLQHPWLQ